MSEQNKNTELNAKQQNEGAGGASQITELSTEELNAVAGGKTYLIPEKTETAVQVTCVDDLCNIAFNHYNGQVAVVTGSLGITLGFPYKYYLRVHNEQYEIMEVIPSIPKYPTCDAILGVGNSQRVRIENAVLVRYDYSKMTEYEI